MDFGRFGEIYRDLDEIWWILANVGGFGKTSKISLALRLPLFQITPSPILERVDCTVEVNPTAGLSL